MKTTISETPLHHAKNDIDDFISPDDVPGGIGKFFQTTIVNPSPQKAKKPPLPKLQKISIAPKVNARKKSPEEYTQIKNYSNAFKNQQDKLKIQFRNPLQFSTPEIKSQSSKANNLFSTITQTTKDSTSGQMPSLL